MPSKRSRGLSGTSSRKWPARHSQVSSNLPSTTTQVDHPDQDASYSRESEDDPEHFNEVIMAVDMRERGTVGCCYYFAREEKLFLMEDLKLGGVDIVDMCKSVNFGLNSTD
jgi:DNA mismatch repair protein MSH5